MELHFDFSTTWKFAAFASAAVLVLIEQWTRTRPFRSLSLWFAFGAMLFGSIAIFVESEATRRLETERKADLMFIQKQNSRLISLCWEINLKNYDTARYDEGSILQIETYVPVTDLNTTGQFGEYIFILFHPDSGWYRDTRGSTNWPSIIPKKDTIQNTIRFRFTPFGVKWKSQMAWQAERLADMAQVRMFVQLSYGIDDEIQDDITDTHWSPVRSISVFANDFRPENLITRLTPRRRSATSLHDFLHFHPEGQQVVDSGQFRFNIDLLQMRSNLLQRLESD